MADGLSPLRTRPRGRATSLREADGLGCSSTHEYSLTTRSYRACVRSNHAEVMGSIQVPTSSWCGSMWAISVEARPQITRSSELLLPPRASTNSASTPSRNGNSVPQLIHGHLVGRAREFKRRHLREANDLVSERLHRAGTKRIPSELSLTSGRSRRQRDGSRQGSQSGAGGGGRSGRCHRRAYEGYCDATI